MVKINQNLFPVPSYWEHYWEHTLCYSRSGNS